MAFKGLYKFYIRNITKIDTHRDTSCRYYVNGVENKVLRVQISGILNHESETIPIEDLWWGNHYSSSLLNFEKNIVVGNIDELPWRSYWIISECDYIKYDDDPSELLFCSVGSTTSTSFYVENDKLCARFPLTEIGPVKLTSTSFYVENDKLCARFPLTEIGPVKFSDVIFALKNRDMGLYTFVPYPLENKECPKSNSDLHFVDSIFKIIKSYAISQIEVNDIRAVITFEDSLVKISEKPNNSIINDFIIVISSDPFKIHDIKLHTKHVTIFFKR